MSEIVAGALMLGGLFFVLAGVIGIIRLPDFYARLHATSKCDTLGLALLVGGVAIHAGATLTTVKIVLIAVFVAVVNATGAHAMGRAAYRSGLQPWLPDRQEPR
jgi:multicomponent Na+:H+ antiporter subunit G